MNRESGIDRTQLVKLKYGIWPPQTSTWTKKLLDSQNTNEDMGLLKWTTYIWIWIPPFLHKYSIFIRSILLHLIAIFQSDERLKTIYQLIFFSVLDKILPELWVLRFQNARLFHLYTTLSRHPLLHFICFFNCNT